MQCSEWDNAKKKYRCSYKMYISGHCFLIIYLIMLFQMYCKFSGSKRLLISSANYTFFWVVVLNFSDCWSLPCFLWCGESNFCSHTACPNNYEKWAWKDYARQDFWGEGYTKWANCGMESCSHYTLFVLLESGFST